MHKWTHPIKWERSPCRGRAALRSRRSLTVCERHRCTWAVCSSGQWAWFLPPPEGTWPMQQQRQQVHQPEWLSTERWSPIHPCEGGLSWTQRRAKLISRINSLWSQLIDKFLSQVTENQSIKQSLMVRIWALILLDIKRIWTGTINHHPLIYWWCVWLVRLVKDMSNIAKRWHNDIIIWITCSISRAVQKQKWSDSKI